MTPGAGGGGSGWPLGGGSGGPGSGGGALAGVGGADGENGVAGADGCEGPPGAAHGEESVIGPCCHIRVSVRVPHSRHSGGAPTCTCYSMHMSTLDRRVQVLFDPVQYAALEHEASLRNQSVAAVIREAVAERLREPKTSATEALERLFASGDAHPTPGPIDWEAEKDSFEREFPTDPQ